MLKAIWLCRKTSFWIIAEKETEAVNRINMDLSCILKWKLHVIEHELWQLMTNKWIYVISQLTLIVRKYLVDTKYLITL